MDHLVAPATAYQCLEGPVFGEWVAICQTAQGPEGPWANLTSDPSRTNACEGSNRFNPQWRLVLYQTIDDAKATTTKDSCKTICAVPREVSCGLKRLLQTQVDAKGAALLPLEVISEAHAEAFPNDRPSERLGEDPNLEPDSDEDAVEAASGCTPSEQELGVRKHFHCKDCEADQHPKARRRTAVAKTYRVKHVVGLDLVEVTNATCENHYWLNVVYRGSGFQQVGLVGNDHRKTAENVWTTFMDV